MDESEQIEVTADILAELDAIAASSEDGRLHPEAVVAFARRPDSALHAKFEWDDSVAAEQYRLQQARSVIRAQVRVSEVVGRRCRAYVSVPSDRTSDGGYRPTDAALSRTAIRMQMVESVLEELAKARDRYPHLPELNPLWLRIEAAISDYHAALTATSAVA